MYITFCGVLCFGENCFLYPGSFLNFGFLKAGSTVLIGVNHSVQTWWGVQ